LVTALARALVFAAANQPKEYARLETGHLPHLEAPVALAALLIEWFSIPPGREVVADERAAAAR
jgi:hypothetical protein